MIHVLSCQLFGRFNDAPRAFTKFVIRYSDQTLRMELGAGGDGSQGLQSY